MNQLRKNIIICYFDGSLYSLVAMFISGGILQAFLLESGMDAQRVSVFVSLIQIVEITAMLTLSPLFENSKQIIKIYSKAHLLLIPMLLAMIVCCYVSGVSGNIKYGILLAGAVVTAIGLGMISFLSYKLCYLILDMNQYGEIIAAQGIFVGVSSFMTASLVSKVTSSGDYLRKIGFFLIASVILLIINTFVALQFKDLGLNISKDHVNKKKVNLLRYRSFTSMIVPFFIRGFATGTFGLFTTIGYYLGVVDAGMSAKMVAIGNIAVFLTFLFYRKFAVKHKDKELILFSSLIMTALMTLAFVFEKPLVFLCLYFWAFCFRTIFETVSPVALVPIIEYDIVAQYSAWRGALHMAGLAFSGFVTIPMIDRFGVVPTMIFNGILFIISSIVNYYCIKKFSSLEKADM